ncbi:zinc finger and BTB domain-containing protein 25 [Thalassophryne amazonica]|uniref:zinc finger and BTB domain-containing protein 25 n=1 Tax=Thalassophryne amazonica TaxID=390379 RepID=UPI0014725A72|nr:zinc finger and BTB domain-containing protein 25 [Thalassophryne amazonica]
MDVSTHSLFLLQQLNIQREFGFLCDCTVAIGNVYFKAHRAVLAAFSNYFKMIFIHQSSECIKIQPTDIQPDVFSYLLHIMYTGMCPKQPVDQIRLQDGIKFLHAYQLCRKPGEGAADTPTDVVRMSNLYGIQISSQLASKDAAGVQKSTAVSQAAPEDGRSSSRGTRSHTQLSLAVGLESICSDHQVSALRNVCSVASGDDSDISTRIKQEQVEDEEVEDRDGEEGRGAGSLSPTQDNSPTQDLLFKDRPLALLCPRCGERCSSPEDLREHLFSHALDPGLSQCIHLDAGVDEVQRGSHEQLDDGCLEEALRQSQALANQLAAELRRSRGGGGTSPTATILHSRKRKIACAVCSLRFSHKSQLQEHMYAHTGKPSRHHRYNRLCSQLVQASTHICESTPEVGGGGAGGGASALEEANRDNQDNGSSCYSLDSEISQESVDGVPVE